MPPQKKPPIDIPTPEGSPRAGGYKVGDKVTMYGKALTVVGTRPDGTPILDMAPVGDQPAPVRGSKPAPAATPQAPKKDKYTVDELADLYKKQNPQFANVESITLVNRILKDHPETFKRLDLSKQGGGVHYDGTTPQITFTGQLSPGDPRSPATSLGRVAAGAARQPDTYGLGEMSNTDTQMREFMKDLAPMALFPVLSRTGFAKGAVGAAGAGAMGGQVGEIIDKLSGGGVEPDTGLVGRRAQDALFGGATELGGRALGAGLRGAASPFKFALGGTLQDAPQTGREMISRGYGIHFTPAQVADELSQMTGKPAGLLSRGEESRAFHNPYSRSIAVTGAKERARTAKSTVFGLVNQFGPQVPANITGKRVAEVIENVGKPAWQRQVDKLSSNVNAKAKGVMIDVTSLRKEAQDELNEIALQQMRLNQIDEEGNPIMPTGAKMKMLGEIAQFPDRMPFVALMGKRTQWMGVSPQITELISGEAKGTAKHYTQLSTKLLDEAAKGGGAPPPSVIGGKIAQGHIIQQNQFYNQAKTQWQTANPGKDPAANMSAIATLANQMQQAAQAAASAAPRGGGGFEQDWNVFRNFTRKGAEVFESKVITDALNKNPEEVVKLVKGDDITDILRLRRAIKGYAENFGSPADKIKAEVAWKRFQVSYIRENILAPLDGNMNGLEDSLNKMTPAVKKVLFDDPQSRATMLRLTQLGKAMANADKSLGVLMGHQDPFANIKLPTQESDLLDTSKGILRSIRPYIVAKIAWNPTATRFFLRGLAGLESSPPSGNQLRDFVNHIVLGKGSKAALKAGGVITNRRLGAAMADIIRAYDIANIYDEDKAQQERANEELKKGQISSPQFMEKTQGSTPVPSLHP